MNRYFIITVDTECDNQWDANAKQETKNAHYIPRFQELCENYNFFPVYLVDYEMAQNSFLQSYLSKKRMENRCEIGMHLHSWNTPPFSAEDHAAESRPYLIEYSKELMKNKIDSLHEVLVKSFGDNIVSHRAGRWAVNQEYLSILNEKGYLIDCSITPHVNWNKTKGLREGGPDYRKYSSKPFFVSGTNILEIPMTIELTRYSKKHATGLSNIIKKAYYMLFGKKVWCRLSVSSFDEIKKIIEIAEKKGNGYIEFMLHSSELMESGSPYYKTKQDIENLYFEMSKLFEYLRNKGYVGITLSGFRNLIIMESNIKNKKI